MLYRDGKLEGIISIYVDDFLYAGTQKFIVDIVNKLKDKFLIGSSASQTFKYVGLNIESVEGEILVDQLQYASGLKPINISRAKAMNKTSELSEEESNEFKGLVGQLSWVAVNTR